MPWACCKEKLPRFVPLPFELKKSVNAFYLILDLAVLAFPLALSFDRKVAFYRQWRYVLPAIGINAVLFLIWDIYFTANGIWSFNERYTMGWSLAGLPLEEYLFFLVVPYACLFLYESIRVYTPWNPSGPWVFHLVALLNIGLITVAFLNSSRWYTFSSFLVAAFLLAVVRAQKASWLGRFGIFFLVSLIPFFLMNSALTGSFTEEPVVIYNNDHNLGIRMGTIPFEDLFYSLTMLLLPLAVFEWLRVRVTRPAFSS